MTPVAIVVGSCTTRILLLVGGSPIAKMRNVYSMYASPPITGYIV